VEWSLNRMTVTETTTQHNCPLP